MKITCLFGSARIRGNSASIANHFLEQAEQLGAEITRFTLNKLNYKGCQGCESCKKKLTSCAVKDDMKTVLDTVKETDILVLATPVYYSDVSSQMKAFIDRTYSYLEPDYMSIPNPSRLEKGKKLVFIQTQEAGPENYKDIFDKYSMFFKFYGFEACELIQACNIGQNARIEDHPDILAKTAEVAKQMCAAG